MVRVENKGLTTAKCFINLSLRPDRDLTGQHWPNTSLLKRTTSASRFQTAPFDIVLLPLRCPSAQTIEHEELRSADLLTKAMGELAANDKVLVSSVARNDLV